MTIPDLESSFQAERARAAARPHRISMGTAFVRGRTQAARGARLLGLATYLACGCALAAIAALAWWHAGGFDVTTASASGAFAAWLVGLMFGR